MRPIPAVFVLSSLACADPAGRTALRWPAARAGAGARSPAEIEIVASDAQPSTLFGTHVASAGDVDGDGYGDVIVGAAGSEELPGPAYVYRGGVGGIDPSSEVRLDADLREQGLVSVQSVAGAGDLDGDGFDDVLVGVATDGNKGSVHVYRGGAGGVDPTSEVRLTASDGRPGDTFGASVAGVGDLNGDGYVDVVVGALGVDTFRGAIYVYLGGQGGIDPTSELRILAPDGSIGDFFGASVAGAGDVDGDGYDDVIVGAYGDDEVRGAAYLYRGSGSGLDPASELRLVASDGAPQGYFGMSVAGAGDTDDDGFSDVIVGASNPSDRGAAYVYRGGPGGLDPASEIRLVASVRDVGDAFGASVASAGDVDGDGKGDVVVGAYGRAGKTGIAYVYRGSEGGIDPASEIRLRASDRALDDHFGGSVAGAGDVDGNGKDDLIVGANRDDDAGNNAGAAYVLVACTIVGYLDGDGDGAGDPSSGALFCAVPDGHVSNGDDCDDGDPSVWSGAEELCDGLDNDCDGAVDDEPADGEIWYADADADGYVAPDSDLLACARPDGYASASDLVDCDDREADVFPGATEIAGDGVDQDCDGVDPGAPDQGPNAAEQGGSGCGCAVHPQSGTAPLSFGFGLLALWLRRRRPEVTGRA